MEQSDYYLVRVNELSGKDVKNIKLSFPATIVDAYEVNGQEKKTGTAAVNKNALVFDLSHYTIRSYAVKLQSPVTNTEVMAQASVDLPYNADVISFDTNRDDGNFNDGQSIPAELLPSVVESEDIHFTVNHKTDGENNAVACSGQTISLPQGDYTKLYLLAAANEDTQADFSVDGQPKSLHIQQWTGKVCQFYNRILSSDRNSVVKMQNPYAKTDNIAWFASHTHNGYPSRNEAYQYCYLYKYEVKIPAGTKTLTLPDNNRIKVLAVTVVSTKVENAKPLQPLYDNFKGNPEFKLR